MINKLKGHMENIFNIIKKPEMKILPGNLAFFLVLSLIPVMTIIIIIGSYFSVSLDIVIDLINKVLPEQVGSILIEVLSSKGFDTGISFFVITALMVASNGTLSIINASNMLYGVKDADVIKSRVKAILLLIIIVSLFVFMLIVPIFGNQILNFLKHFSGVKFFINELIIIFNGIKWPISFIIIYFNIKLIYVIAPSKKILSQNTTYGALVTTILWILVTSLFAYYVRYFANYNVLYGNLSNIIILMLWIYFLSYIFVLGMALNVSKVNKKIKIANTN